MYTKRIINKVPGNIPPESKKEKQGFIGDLCQKSTLELKDILLRQEQILSNRSFINKLADKGVKIIKLKESVEEELKKRDEAEKLSKLLSALSVNGKSDVEELEWTGNCNPGCRLPEEKTDLSDDEQDPLKILASHSGAGFHNKKHKAIKPDKPLVQPSDLEVEDELEEYAKNLCQKLDTPTTAPKAKEKFLPFKTLRHKASDLKARSTDNENDSHKIRSKNKHWEVTAATPPPPVHGDTKMVTLQESIKLQCEQQQKLKVIQMQHAAERLMSWSGGSMGTAPSVPGKYREPEPEPGQSSSDELSESEEVQDDEAQDGGGVVIYNLIDVTND